LNGNIFFELFSTDLDERLASAGYKNDKEKKQNKTAEQADNISSRGFRHENENTAYFWINSALEASNRPQITLCIRTNVLISISERFCPNFEQINILSTVTAITAACILN